MKHIFFSGIGGNGLAPLAQLALDAGYSVSGTDRETSPNTEHLAAIGQRVMIGQDGSQISSLHASHPIDWFVGTAALPPDHPELVFAQKNHIKISKRDELLNEIIGKHNLKLVAVSGTHGKTTTTGMLIWLLKKLRVPLSYSIGTNISFGPSASYTPGSKYFIYEADEFDKNMLKFKPYLSIIPSIDYDHPDTYPSVEDYKQAFRQFIQQSRKTILFSTALGYLKINTKGKIIEIKNTDPRIANIKLAGIHNRNNGFLALESLKILEPAYSQQVLLKAINSFPGTQRRMEKLSDNLYTDYAHHPEEIKATMQLAQEINQNVVIVYQPHQNVRQHQIKKQYKNSFVGAKKVYWLPTYQSREYKDLEVLKPADLFKYLDKSIDVEAAEMNNEMFNKILEHKKNNDLVVVMGAGSVDSWLRQKLSG